MRTYLLAATVLLIAAGPLEAQQPKEAPAPVAVSYGDLDLTTAHGRDTLDRRLRAAARDVCRDAVVASTFDWIGTARCRRATIAHVRGIAATAAARADQSPRLAVRSQTR